MYLSCRGLAERQYNTEGFMSFKFDTSPSGFFYAQLEDPAARNYLLWNKERRVIVWRTNENALCRF